MSLSEACACLGFALERFSPVVRAPSLEATVAAWRELLPALRAEWKATAREQHPDAGGDAAKFARARMAWDLLRDESCPRQIWHSAVQKARVQSQVSPFADMNVVTVTVVTNGWHWTTSSTTTA